METTHTRGPWLSRVDGTSSGRWIEIYTAGPYYRDGSEFEIARLGTVETSSGLRNGVKWKRTPEADEIEANGRLLVAAPDLLDALRPFVTRPLFEGFSVAEWNAFVAAGRGAIAKAEGKVG